MDLDPASLIGRTFGEVFRVGAFLGKGGMGSVFLATHIPLKREVALKLLQPRFVEQTVYLRRFLVEARAAARLNHPNIVQIYDANQDKATGLAYLALELVRGGSLKPIPKPVGPRLTAEIARDAARGLSAAHKAGIVHRDIKPDNMLLAEGQVKLTDFGIARIAEQNTRLTASGYVLGTPRYSSPEQFGGAELDGRSDLFSLGVVCYELLSGRLPHAGASPASLIYAICHSPPRPLTELCPDVPADLADLVHRLLAKEPDERPADADSLIKELEQLMPGLPEGPTLVDLQQSAPTQPVPQPGSSISDVSDTEIPEIFSPGTPTPPGADTRTVVDPPGLRAAAALHAPPLVTPDIYLSPLARLYVDRIGLAHRLAEGGHPVAALQAVGPLALELGEDPSACQLILSLRDNTPTPSATPQSSPALDPIRALLQRISDRLAGEPRPAFRATNTLRQGLLTVAKLDPALEPLCGQITALLEHPGSPNKPLSAFALVQLRELQAGLAVPWRWDVRPHAYDDADVPLDDEGRQQVQAAARVLLGLVSPAEQSQMKSWNQERQAVPVVSLAQVGSIHGGSVGLPTLLSMVSAWLGTRPRAGLAATGALDTRSIPPLPRAEQFDSAAYESYLSVRIAPVEEAPAKLRALLEQCAEVTLCLVPEGNRQVLEADLELRADLDASDLELRYVATVGDALAPDLFEKPLELSPLRTLQATRTRVGDSEDWNASLGLARLLTASSAGLLALALYRVLEIG